jgi:hypothetical protein
MAATQYQLLEYRLQQTEAKIVSQEQHIDRLEALIADMKLEAAKREEKRLLWGIGALGSVVMTLGTIIWSYRSFIFK